MLAEFKKQYPEAKLIANEEVAQKPSLQGFKLDGGIEYYFT